MAVSPSLGKSMPLEYKIKQIVVIIKSLNMRKGKLAAQVSHASQGFLTSQYDNRDNLLVVQLTDDQREWLTSGTAKIVVSVDTEAELLDLVEKAKAAGVTTYVVKDAGNTEFHGVETITCAAFGPAKVEILAGLTGHLKLM